MRCKREIRRETQDFLGLSERDDRETKKMRDTVVEMVSAVDVFFLLSVPDV